MTAPLRADARRNLERVLDAAASAFAELGADASVDEIARRAGVGRATVFRRFPVKESLLAAVVLRRVGELAAAAEAAAEEDDVGAAFERFFRAAATAYARNRALVEWLDRCHHEPAVAALVEAVERLVARAQAAGAVRPDVSGADVLALVPAASSYPAVILDGLRPSA